MRMIINRLERVGKNVQFKTYLFCRNRLIHDGDVVRMWEFRAGGSRGELPPAVKSEPVATNSSETRTIKDAKGDVEIPVNPVRIADVSGSTEELLVLGYKPVITGNTDMANSLEITPILKKNCLM